jgi:hypothetical protein
MSREPRRVTPLSSLQRDAAFHENRAGQVGPGREHDGAALLAAASIAFWIAFVFMCAVAAAP